MHYEFSFIFKSHVRVPLQEILQQLLTIHSSFRQGRKDLVDFL